MFRQFLRDDGDEDEIVDAKLLRLGARESGTARLDEAVAAYRAAFEERTRARVPRDWAMSLGNQGVALMLIAERTGDGAMAKTALDQIAAAAKTSREGGDARTTDFYEAQLQKAQSLVEHLAEAALKKASTKR